MEHIYDNRYNCRLNKLPLRNKIGGCMAMAYFRGGGIETTLSSLNLFFYVQHMIAASSGLYQLGAGALTSPDGKGQFDQQEKIQK